MSVSLSGLSAAARKIFSPHIPEWPSAQHISESRDTDGLAPSHVDTQQHPSGKFWWWRPHCLPVLS